MKRALTQEREASVKEALASSIVSGLHNVWHYVQSVKRKCQVLLVSSVTQALTQALASSVM